MKGFATMNSKIYSRPRIRLPKIFFSSGGDKNLKRKQKIVKIFIIMVIAFSTVKIVLDAISPIFEALCEDKAKSIATIISNNESTNVMKDHTYDELFTIEKDNDGNITMIKSNVIQINEIISDVAVKIQNSINERGKALQVQNYFLVEALEFQLKYRLLVMLKQTCVVNFLLRELTKLCIGCICKLTVRLVY